MNVVGIVEYPFPVDARRDSERIHAIDDWAHDASFREALWQAAVRGARHGIEQIHNATFLLRWQLQYPIDRWHGTCAVSSKTVSNSDLLLALSPFHFHPQMPRSENSYTARKRRLSASARRALEMLAAGFATEKIMIDQGFTRRLLIGLLRTKLAMRYSAPLKVGDSTVEVTYMMITAAGRRALKE